VETTFIILAGDTEDASYTSEDSFDVAAGAERVVSVPVRNNTEARVNVGDALLSFFPLGISFDDESFEVHCPTTAARPTVAVQGAKLPQTGEFNLAIPLLGVALLAGGGGMLALTGRRLGN
jgi:LPXTG-motif cell wall-anchored protein